MRRVAGFTLTELLIALLLAAIVGTAVVTVLVNQQDFYGEMEDMVFAEQSLRAGLDLMASEVGTAAPGDLMAAEEDSVSVRYELYRSVVCESNHTLDRATLFVYDSVTNANVPSGFRGFSFSNPDTDSALYADGWEPSENVGSGITTCELNGAPLNLETWRYRTVDGWRGEFSDTVPARGGAVVKYGRLTYRFAASSFTSGTALWRGTQELVAPFGSDASFSYVMDDGSVQASVSPADFGDVRAVRASGEAVGEGTNPYGVGREFRFDVRLVR